MVKKKKKLKIDLNKRVDELEDKLKRALADYHNLLKRIEQRQGSWQDEAKARIVDKLLDVYDDLCRVKSHLDDKGLAMIVNQFWGVLQSEGIEEIEAKGREFDPESMDCVQVVKGKENQVMGIVSKGYNLNGKTIRPVRVKVGKGGK